MVNSILIKIPASLGIFFKRKKIFFFSLGNCLLKHHDLIFREGPTAKARGFLPGQQVFDSHLMI